MGCHCLLQPYLLEHYVSCCPSCQLTWYCQNPYDPSSCTTSAPGPHRGKPKSSRAASGANPSGRPRGSVTKEEDPIPSHHCSTSFRLNPHDQLGRFCVYGIYKRTLRAPTKEDALALMLWTLEARTHRSRTRLESELPPQQVQISAVLEGMLGR